MSPKHKIAVIGLWHLGEIYSTGLSEIGNEVWAISEDESVIQNFQKGVPPLPEPQLSELISKNVKEGRLFYSSDFSKVSDCDLVWITFDTPVDDNDEVDLTPILDALKKVEKYLAENSTVVISSQIPVGTSEELIETIKKNRSDLSFEYVYTPENLQLGKAVECFLNPTRIIAGVSSEKALGTMKEVFAGLPNNFEIISMSPASAEMGKHALNAFLCAEISFANDLADISEKVGADMLDVTKMLKSDPRIGPKAYLDAGVSFSGGTLNRDIKILSKFADSFSIESSVVQAIYKKNEARKKLIAARLQEELGDLRGKVVAICGLTYKPGTKTLRRSYPLEVAKMLIAEGVNVRLHDPQAEEAEVVKVGPYFKDVYEAASGANAIVFITTWPEFREIDFSLLKEKAANAVIFDTTNFLTQRIADIEANGFKYKGVGRAKYK